MGNWTYSPNKWSYFTLLVTGFRAVPPEHGQEHCSQRIQWVCEGSGLDQKRQKEQADMMDFISGITMKQIYENDRGPPCGGNSATSRIRLWRTKPADPRSHRSHEDTQKKHPGRPGKLFSTEPKRVFPKIMVPPRWMVYNGSKPY